MLGFLVMHLVAQRCLERAHKLVEAPVRCVDALEVLHDLLELLVFVGVVLDGLLPFGKCSRISG